MARNFVEQDVWETDVARFGIDIWMTTSAITGGFRICQAFLGAKIHDAKDPSMDLSAMLVQVVSSVFDLMGTREYAWMDVQGSRPVPLFGMEHAVGLEPVRVDQARMIRHFQSGVAELKDVWSRALAPPLIRQLEAVGRNSGAAFNLPVELWVPILHGFALAYHRRVMDRGHLLQALTPLYMGRVAAFVGETAEASAEQVEAIQEDACMVFEKMKPDLVAQWQGDPQAGHV